MRKPKNPPKPYVGAPVRVENDRTHRWRITGIDRSAGLADLTCMTSFDRIDYRGVALTHLTVLEGILG